MKIYRLTEFYDHYVDSFYSEEPSRQNLSFQDQLKEFKKDGFSWFGSWERALKQHGVECVEMTCNPKTLLDAYAFENGLKFSEDKRERMIAFCVHHLKQVKPDILWFDCHRTDLLKAIKAEVPSIKKVLGWVGSAIPRTDVWKEIDLVLSCAPESLPILQAQGVTVQLFHHAFDPDVVVPTPFEKKRERVSFVGNIILSHHFHANREKILMGLIHAGRPLEIYSPSAGVSFKKEVRHRLERGLFDVFEFARKMGVSNSTLLQLPVVGRAANWYSRPSAPLDPQLKRALRPAVFGSKMLKTISDTVISLNIHADSSPVAASNMRLFEITGMGSVLLTEARQNLKEFYEPDAEVVTYSSLEEASEKIKWLLANTNEARAIAEAGRKKTLSTHTFLHRSHDLMKLLRH